MKLKIPISIASMLILPLATALFLGSLLLTAGIACGGDDDDSDSRPTSRPSESEPARDSDRDARDEEEDSRQDQQDEDVEDRDTSTVGEEIEDAQEDERPSPLSPGSDRPGRGVSVQDLGTVPNLRYDRVALVNVPALLSSELLSGDGPIHVAIVEGIGRVLQRLQQELGSTEESPLDLSLLDLQIFIGLEWGHWYDYEDRGAAFSIQGDYQAESIRDSLSASEDIELLQEQSGELETWRLTGYYSSDLSNVIFSNEQVYGVNRDIEESSLFQDALAQGDWLLEDSDNPIARALEKLGSSWLMFAKTDYCDAGCLVSAFAVKSTSESAVEANWVVLFESAEIAAFAEEASVDGLAVGKVLAFASDGDWAEPHSDWITRVYTDDEFLVFELVVPMEEAALFFAGLVGGLKHP